jgi:CubicO group peptidase (beta-lactamase class C family)
MEGLTADETYRSRLKFLHLRVLVGQRTSIRLSADMPLFRAYHRLSGAEHQQWFDQLSAAGYRMISLCVYGPPANARYAAVWVQRSGPHYHAFHNRSAADYQALVDSLTPQGYVPVLLSATGDRHDATFAGVFEQLWTGWAGRHGLTQAEFDNEDAMNMRRGLFLHEMCCYGTVAQPIFAAVWRPPASHVHAATWRFFTRETYQQLFDAVVPVGNRPFLVSPSDGPRYHALFKDDSVGEFVARHHIDADEYQREFDRQRAAGRMPIAVRATGRSPDNRQDLYGAVFAADDIAEPRSWTFTGTYQPRFAFVEMLVRSFMQTHGIRAGTLAIAQSGRLLCSRGFTFAESGYPARAPDARFRVASLSKLFTAAAIAAFEHALPFPQNLGFFNRPIFPLLGISAVALPGQTADSRINTITLRHLIDHTGGWTRDVASPSLHPGTSGFDPCSGTSLRTIGADFALNHVVSARDVARYMFGEPLQYTPGDATLPLDRRYSNFGYLLLGLAIETLTGRPFGDYLRDAVLTPLGVHDVRVADSFNAAPNEVRYHCLNAMQSVFRPDLSPAWVPEQYGGMSMEVNAATGGLLASAPAVATTIGQVAVWGMGGRAAGSSRIGAMAGTFACASSLSNGMDWAVLFNGNDGLTDALRGNFLTSINSALAGL